MRHTCRKPVSGIPDFPAKSPPPPRHIHGKPYNLWTNKSTKCGQAKSKKKVQGVLTYFSKGVMKQRHLCHSRRSLLVHRNVPSLWTGKFKFSLSLNLFFCLSGRRIKAWNPSRLTFKQREVKSDKVY